VYGETGICCEVAAMISLCKEKYFEMDYLAMHTTKVSDYAARNCSLNAWLIDS
jgi:hypothetical protein